MWNVINLLRFIVAIVIVDIVIRIWFSSGLNLVFSSTEFNNIITPLATIIAVIIYYSALRNSNHQNKILMSQNLKPYFDKKIDELYNEIEPKIIEVHYSSFEEDPINGGMISDVKKFKFINYTDAIRYCILQLGEDTQYVQTKNEIADGKSINHFVINSLPFHKTLYSLNELVFSNKYSHFVYKVDELLRDIKISKLLEEDKQNYFKNLYNAYFKEYMEFIKYFGVTLQPEFLSVIRLSGNESKHPIVSNIQESEYYKHK